MKHTLLLVTCIILIDACSVSKKYNAHPIEGTWRFALINHLGSCGSGGDPKKPTQFNNDTDITVQIQHNNNKKSLLISTLDRKTMEQILFREIDWDSVHSDNNSLTAYILDCPSVETVQNDNRTQLTQGHELKQHNDKYTCPIKALTLSIIATQETSTKDCIEYYNSIKMSDKENATPINAAHCSALGGTDHSDPAKPSVIYWRVQTVSKNLSSAPPWCPPDDGQGTAQGTM